MLYLSEKRIQHTQHFESIFLYFTGHFNADENFEIWFLDHKAINQIFEMTYVNIIKPKIFEILELCSP